MLSLTWFVFLQCLHRKHNEVGKKQVTCLTVKLLIGQVDKIRVKALRQLD